MEHRVFVLWLGEAEMSANRRASLATLHNTGCRIEFITDETLGCWIVPGHDLHPAYRYLTATHQADCVRAYLMHHHGGGYSDLKPTTESWSAAFAELERSRRLWGNGYREPARSGVARVPNRTQYRVLRAAYRRLIGNGAFIFRANTRLTAAWNEELHRRLDRLHRDLAVSPGRHPRERRGEVGDDGTPTGYPVRWTELLGDILHPLCLRFPHRLGYSVPRPSRDNYL
jgi:hypothetical protein